MPTKDKKPHPNDHVYLARRQSDGALKIGVAQNILNRIGSLESENKCKMELIAAIEGSYSLEAALHKLFERYAIPNRARRISEWFIYNEEIIEYARLNMHPAIDFAVQKRLPLRAAPKRRKSFGKGEYVFVPRVFELLIMKQAKERRRISTKKMAREAGIAYPSCFYLVRGKPLAKLHADMVFKLRSYFDCKLDDMFTLVSRDELPQPARNESAKEAI